MHVGVDQAGQQHLVLGQPQLLLAGQVGAVRFDGDDRAAPDANGAADLGTADDGVRSVDHQVVGVGHRCPTLLDAAN